MGAIELRDKLIKQFEIFIQDESKLVTLDGVFDSMNVSPSDSNTNSLIPEQHYKVVEVRRDKRLNSETQGKNWDDVKLELKKKYGF
ncbi:hypothetical protein IMCC3317_05350 [Kordia antarctica]|uniref:Uncharacterized protein n=1 Tax=Kordia antarctica TaxID=1218801 RepID=A0A7L4ZFC4_9FLAO|nr:hypothetical protein [Kordia antarctica]QHI35189.1 hypothetical protein IMCC3317_05350 [Kordia antarctica]